MDNVLNRYINVNPTVCLILQPFSLLELKRWEYLHWMLEVMFLFVCLFGVYRPIPEFFTHVTITGEGLQILTYALHSRPLSSEGSLACHTYCDMGHPFIIVISEDL